MVDGPYPRVPIDEAAYVEMLLDDGARGRCFICEIVAGEERHRVIYRDDVCVAFFNLYPRLFGYVLVAPIEHKTEVVGEFTEAEYVELQRRVYRIGRAVSECVSTERLYIFTFGSQLGVSHVHWHITALPPRVPFLEQQMAAVTTPDYFDIPLVDRNALAQAIADHINN